MPSDMASGEEDAVLPGAMGLPSVRWRDGREMTPQIDLRERFQSDWYRHCKAMFAEKLRSE